MYRRILAAGVITGAILLALPSYASNCASRTTVVERLESKYEETFSAGGLQSMRSGQTLVEVFASEEKGTFTILLTMPTGMTCIVAAGTDWHQVEPEAVVKGSAS